MLRRRSNRKYLADRRCDPHGIVRRISADGALRSSRFHHDLEHQNCGSHESRTGLTLLEIFLALAIFSASMVALSQLAWSGSRATVQARLKTQATIRCEAKLNEVIAGISPMQSCSEVQFPDDTRWTWSETVYPSSYPELVQIELTVNHHGSSQSSNMQVTLRRWSRLQSVFAQAAEANKEEADAKANLEPGNTSTTTSSSSSSQ